MGLSSNTKILLQVISLATLLLGARAQDPGELVSTADHIFRNAQYCEIIYGKQPQFDPLTQQLEVRLTISWNGTGGVCPDSPGFYNITDADVKAVHGEDTSIINYNGINEWVVSRQFSQPTEDGINRDGTSVVAFEYGTNLFPDGSGMIMLEGATIDLSGVGTDSLNSATYQETPVARYLDFVWDAGTTVYELVAPNCESVYVMQSFRVGNPRDWGVRGGEAELTTLVSDGSINLPAGWTYRTRLLEEDLTISGTDGITQVVNDDLRNAYSKMDEPFDRSLVCPGIKDEPSGENEDQPVKEETTNDQSMPVSDTEDMINIMWNGTKGECPTSPGYYDITEDDVRDQHGEVPLIIFNGIRQWMISSSERQVPLSIPDSEPSFVSYGNGIFDDGSGLIMMNVGTVQGLDTSSGSSNYEASIVSRGATFTWFAGTRVYELVAPNCTNVFTMQSLYLGRPGNEGGLEGVEIASPEEEEEILINLAATRKINPPEGWTYRSRVLETDLSVYGTNGSTPVLQDDLGNSYSQLDAITLLTDQSLGCIGIGDLPTSSPTPLPSLRPTDNESNDNGTDESSSPPSIGWNLVFFLFDLFLSAMTLL